MSSAFSLQPSAFSQQPAATASDGDDAQDHAARDRRHGGTARSSAGLRAVAGTHNPEGGSAVRVARAISDAKLSKATLHLQQVEQGTYQPPLFDSGGESLAQRKSIASGTLTRGPLGQVRP